MGIFKKIERGSVYYWYCKYDGENDKFSVIVSNII